MEFLNVYLSAIKDHFFDFEGRAGRKSFWIFVVVNCIISFILGYIPPKVHGMSILSIIYSLGILLPSLGLAARRLHDIGKSGWFILVNLIPFIGSIWFLVLCAKQGDPNENVYGPVPVE